MTTDNNSPVGYCSFAIKDELPEDSEYSLFIGFVFVDEDTEESKIKRKENGGMLIHSVSL